MIGALTDRPPNPDRAPRLLITGATGFIGSRLATAAQRAGCAVTALGLTNTPAETRNLATLRSAGIPVALIPLADMAAISPMLADCEVVFHLAAAQHETDVSNDHFWEVNVRCTERLLEACAAAGIGRLVYASTMGVYGCSGGRLDETSPARPDNIYGRSKLAAEVAVQARADDVRVSVARIGEVYGPNDPRLLKLFRGLAKGRFPMLGACRNRHPLIHVDDLVEGLLLMGSHASAPGEIFILAGDEQPTTEELIRAAAATLGKATPRLRLPLAPVLLATRWAERLSPRLGLQIPLHTRQLDFFRRSLELDNGKARRLLGFKPHIGMAEGLRSTVEWYRAHGFL